MLLYFRLAIPFFLELCFKQPVLYLWLLGHYRAMLCRALFMHETLQVCRNREFTHFCFVAQALLAPEMPYTFALLLLLFLYVGHALDERSVLAAFFNDTHGNAWRERCTDSAGHGCWMSTDPFCTWKGIECNATGSVVTIDLGANSLDGTLSSFLLENLLGLQLLHLAQNPLLRGTLPHITSQLPALKYLSVAECGFSGSIPTIPAPTLSALLLNRNRFAGSLDALMLFPLRSLQNIDVSSNMLSGTIPTAFGQLSLLEELVVASNFLHGLVPSSLGNLPLLRVLNLGSNRLSGAVPDGIADLPALTQLMLAHNQFTTLWTERFTLLSRPQLVDASNNNMTALPLWMQFFEPTMLDLSSNHIQGVSCGPRY